MDSVARRVRADIKKARKPDDEYSEAMTQYHEYRRTGKCSSPEHIIAFRAYEDSTQKEIIEALLFGDADPDEVESAFGVPAKSLQVYEELFFDRSKFLTKLDKISYLNSCSQFAKDLKMRAMNLGPEYVYYTYANIVPKTSAQRRLVQRMFMAAAYKAMAINYNAMESKVTKNAVDHAKLMLKAWEALQKFSEDDLADETDLVKVLTRESDLKKVEMDLQIPEEDIV